MSDTPTTSMPSSSAAEFELRAASRLTGLSPYIPPPREGVSRLLLDANEGSPDAGALLRAARTISPAQVRRYPDAGPLERALAARVGVESARVVVTSGGDDAIDRVCRCLVEPGSNAVVHSPTFEMIPRGVRLAGGTVREVSWLGGAFPVSDFCAAIDAETSLVALVSPNNPTGGVIPTADIMRIASSARECGVLVLVDLAYVEFADEDPTATLRDLDNVVMVRTFSKTFGLAGLRVGYAVAPPRVAGWLRTVGSPYPVSTLSLALAAEALQDDAWQRAFVERVRGEREQLTVLLRDLGVEPLDSCGNFVTAAFTDADTVWESLDTHGVAVRRFTSHPVLAPYLRLSLPGNADEFARLCDALSKSVKGSCS